MLRTLAPWLILVLWANASRSADPAGVPVAYRLPADGPLPRTYRVTLAVVDAKNPDGIVAQFARGAVRTVTAENGGKFSEVWDGLDDNHMPVPPGTYAVRGICMPAAKWAIDGEYHSVTPRLVAGASSFQRPGDQPEPFGGDPVGAPLRDVDVGPNGVAVLYYDYLENGTNCPLIDLKKPVGPGQFIRAFNSGGAGGGSAATTDGETVWAFSHDGGPKFVYRADGKPFGKSPKANRADSYPPEGWVTAMAHFRAGGRRVVFVAQRGKIDKIKDRDYEESRTEFADLVTAHDGANGNVLASIPLARPRGLAVHGDTLYALHAASTGFAVSGVALKDGVPQGEWKRVFAVPAGVEPADLEVDSRKRFYLSDPKANKVRQYDAAGKALAVFGKHDAQKPGSYDADTLMSPGKLATWVDGDGNDRVLIVEQAGPNRLSEWSADGKRLREWLTLQTKANDGYAVDPEKPGDVYVLGHQGWLTRFKLDYAKGTWAVDAVWPEVGTDAKAPGFIKPQLIRANGGLFLASGRSLNVYRLAGDRWVLSAALIAGSERNKPTSRLWHDADNNGRIDDGEGVTVPAPPGVFTYHGQNWLDDLSYAAVGQGTRDVWRLAASGFDAHGNPIFTQWKKLLSDPVFAARAAGKADATHGGNELADTFDSDWCQVDGTAAEGYYVQARGGKNFSANEGAQHTITRYVPDGAGGYRLKWRTGRTALRWTAKPGEAYGLMRVRRPINGIVSVVDQSRCGILLYTDDGLYVDTLFPDERTIDRKKAGIYALPGEFFAGTVYPNKVTGKVCIGLGKYTPLIFEADGWSPTESPVRPLADLQKTVTLLSSQIAAPPEIALSLRGGAGTAKVARFGPALGGASLDGSLSGWEAAEPVTFAPGGKGRSVEVRCLYDPEHLYLRWHVRLGAKVDAKAMPRPERIFSHERGADTLSFYVQGDAEAKPGGPSAGRPGDAKFVFGLAKDGNTVAPKVVGYYPEWTGPTPSPVTFRTPVGSTSFAHAAEVPGAKLGHRLDADGMGFVIAADIPRAAIPRQAKPFVGGSRTAVNFEATLGGRDKFWWSDADGSASRETFDEPTEARLYPGSWSPAQFRSLDNGVMARDWLIVGPFGGPGAEKFTDDPGGKMPGTDRDWKEATREFFEKAQYPPDAGVDPSAKFAGPVVKGYWRDPGEVRWHPARVEDLDTRVKLGSGGQVWYGATWVHAPAATDLTFRLQGHPMTTLRWTLNGEKLSQGKPVGDKDSVRQEREVKVSLKAGWNEVRFRGYCVGYPPFRAGLVIDAPAETLWTLKFRGTP